MERKIYERKKIISFSKDDLIKKLARLTKEEENLRNACNHEIALKFDDHRMYRIGEVYTYFCPACQMRQKVYNELEKTAFKDSRILDLTVLDIKNFKDLSKVVSEFMYNNYDNYYNNKFPKDVLEEMLINAVQLNLNEENTITSKR